MYGDYAKPDASRERSESSVSVSVGEGGQAIVSNGTQAARDAAPETAAKSPPALSDAQHTRMTSVGEPEAGFHSGAVEKITGRSSA